MLDFALYLHIFITIFSILNPLEVIPIFLAITANESKTQRKQTIKKTTIAVMIILLLSTYLYALFC